MPRQRKKSHRRSLTAIDPVWEYIRHDAEEIARGEPALASFVFTNVLNHESLEDAVCHRLADRLDHDDVMSDLIQAFRADLSAVYDRDPACERLIEPLLYFKGFQALQAYRFAHWLYNNGSRDFALYLQSQTSRVLGVDIHPAANNGRGIMLDHATSIVVGETASIGDMSSILHSVTLGGSGKETGDRHPKVGRCVMIGAGSKILGNITVGDCARIAAGSVVLKDVPADTTVAGVPAKVVGLAGCKDPARAMNQMLGQDDTDVAGETEG
ncbi:MAG: serine O-acetyltransferase [Alphaproteobacteria bacterium]